MPQVPSYPERDISQPPWLAVRYWSPGDEAKASEQIENQAHKGITGEKHDARAVLSNRGGARSDYMAVFPETEFWQ